MKGRMSYIAVALNLLLALMLAAAFAGCGETPPTGQNGGEGTDSLAHQSEGGVIAAAGFVNVYNWGEYIDMDVLDLFEQETGIKVNYSVFQSNEEMYSILRGGGANFDVIIPSDYMISRLIEENMLQKPDFSNIPNFGLIDEEYRNLDFDPGNEYSIPYMVGTVGLIYNSAMIRDEMTSWGALFDERYAGQILMFDNPRDAFGIALKYLGYYQNTVSESEIHAAFDLLAAQKPLLQAYVMDQIFDKLESGEAAIGPYYAGDYLIMRENNPDLRFIRPAEGSNSFVDAMVIPANANNKENAETFINFLIRTDIALMNMDYIWYSSANYEANGIFMDENLDFEDYEIMFASHETLANCDVFTDLPPHILELYNDLWITLKS